MATVPTAATALAGLRAIVGDAHVATDPDTTSSHVRDWTGRVVGACEAVVAPATTAQVAAVLTACAAAGLAVVPQGGNTGLVAGAVPSAGSIVLDLRRLDALSIDPTTRVAETGAGVTIAALQGAAAANGLRYAVDLASRDSATVGGTVATNAGGLRVVRHGPTRAQLLGIQAVLADGTILDHRPGLVRDNTGYHLPSLLCGSEGTLAVVTAAQLRLIPAAPRRTVVLLGFTDAARAVVAATALAGWPFVEAVELVLRAGVALVGEVAGLTPPFDAAVYVLTEARAPTGVDDGLAAVVDGLGADDVAVGLEENEARRLWGLRERHTEAIATRGPVHKLDVTLPQRTLAEFVEALPGLVTGIRSQAEVWLFGHAGDGNVHVNVTGLAPDDDDVDDLVLQAVVDRGGSISSEHGIGRAKARWLPLAHTPDELALMRRIKTAFDPAGLLNPGVLFPLDG